MKISAKTLGILALGLTAFSAAPMTQAQVTATQAIVLPTTGTKEIALTGSYEFNTPKVYFLQGGYGVFTSPSLEFGGQLGVSGADHTGTTINAGLFADYYFSNGSEGNTLLPYIGINGGYAHSSGNDGTSVGGQLGVKYFLNSNVAVDVGVQYIGAKNASGQSGLFLGLSTFTH